MDTVDLRESIIGDLDRFRESLQRWETGRFSIAEFDSSTGQRRDITQEHIEHLRRIIVELEGVLAHLNAAG